MTNRVLRCGADVRADWLGLWAAGRLALMKVEAGAREAGMAGAAVSLSGEPNAVFYNPAAAAGAKRFGLSFGHNSYWENVRIETGYFVGNLNERHRCPRRHPLRCGRQSGKPLIHRQNQMRYSPRTIFLSRGA